MQTKDGSIARLGEALDASVEESERLTKESSDLQAEVRLLRSRLEESQVCCAF